MRVYNYWSFSKALELGVTNPNSTKIAKALFEPIVSLDDVVNQAGNPYVIGAHYAKAWNDQTDDIPPNLKKAAGRPDVVNSIGDYFSEEIVDGLVNQLKENEMYNALVTLIRGSDLEAEKIKELLGYYKDGDNAEFLGRAFLYSVVRDNKQKDAIVAADPVDEDLVRFKELIKSKYKKPQPITPPDEIESHEIGYVQELYQVYSEETGEKYVRPEDLESQPKYKRDFNRQRKDYYKAETISRELRDTIRLDETEGFNELKEEMYDGVITTRGKAFPSSFTRLTEVMEKAAQVQLSQNVNDNMLNWVGPGEKKGVCHMLVNDKRLKWTEEDDDE